MLNSIRFQSSASLLVKGEAREPDASLQRGGSFRQSSAPQRMGGTESSGMVGDRMVGSGDGRGRRSRERGAGGGPRELSQRLLPAQLDHPGRQARITNSPRPQRAVLHRNFRALSAQRESAGGDPHASRQAIAPRPFGNLFWYLLYPVGRWRNCPRPTVPTNAPSRTAISPRTVTTAGRPSICQPSKAL